MAFNEEKILPYFLQHYRTFCETIIVYDNYSTDRTFELAQDGADIVRRFKSNNSLRDDIHIQIKDSVWQERNLRGHDWFITVDADELIYAPNILDLLSEHAQQGHRVLRPKGYSMFHEEPLKEGVPLTEQVTHGIDAGFMSKPVVFQPSKIGKMRFDVGCHDAFPRDRLLRCVPKISDPRLKLLHYKFIWGYDEIKRIYDERWKRRNELSEAHNWGFHYTEEYLEGVWKQHRQELQKVI